MSSLSLLCLVFHSLGAILWLSVLLRLLLDHGTYVGFDLLGVFPLFLNKVGIGWEGWDPSGIVSEVLAVC